MLVTSVPQFNTLAFIGGFFHSSQGSPPQAACQFILLRMFLLFQKRDGDSHVILTEIPGSLVPRYLATHLPIINMLVSSACEEAKTEGSTLSILVRQSLHSPLRKAMSVLHDVTGQEKLQFHRPKTIWLKPCPFKLFSHCSSPKVCPHNWTKFFPGSCFQTTQSVLRS